MRRDRRFQRYIRDARRFNPRASHEARRAIDIDGRYIQLVSIHAPHMRRDQRRLHRYPVSSVSIHPPHMRRDLAHCRLPCHIGSFNPRTSHEARPRDLSPVRKAMLVSIHAPHMRRDRIFAEGSRSLVCFNPRASHEARRALRRRRWLIPPVSIHAPHMRRDVVHLSIADCQIRFQSTRLT